MFYCASSFSPVETPLRASLRAKKNEAQKERKYQENLMNRQILIRLLLALLPMFALVSCSATALSGAEPAVAAEPDSKPAGSTLTPTPVPSLSAEEMLAESWASYRSSFIQA